MASMKYSDRKKMREQLQDCGKWEGFKIERERLKAEGLTPPEAWQQAYVTVMNEQSQTTTTWGKG